MKEKYLIEYYKDEYNTLRQAIMVDLELNKLSNGNELIFARSRINPNLNILYRQAYENEKHERIKDEMLINDEWVDILKGDDK